MDLGLTSSSTGLNASWARGTGASFATQALYFPQPGNPGGQVRSLAQTAIVPVQDVLSLGSDARMNRPGDPQHNWSWRFDGGALTHEHAARLRKLAEITGRA